MMPVPLRVHRSWWFSDAALTCTRTQPVGGVGSGRSPMVSPASGSSALIEVAVTASIGATPGAGSVGRRIGATNGPSIRPTKARPATAVCQSREVEFTLDTDLDALPTAGW